MKCFAALWMVCLARLCHCGNGTDDGKSQETQSSSEDLLSGGASQHVPQPTHQTTEYESVSGVVSHSTPVCIDVANLDHNVCDYFEYHFTNVPARLIIPKVNVKELVIGQDVVCNVQGEDFIEYCKLYLKDEQPELIIVKTKGSAIENKYCRNRDKNTWDDASEDYTERFDALKIPAEYRGHFSIDVALIASIPQCTIFEVELLGVNTRFFYPNPGYYATDIHDDGFPIWGASAGNQTCTSCELYSCGETPVLLRASFNYNGFKYFKFDDIWDEISEAEYDEIFGNIVKT